MQQTIERPGGAAVRIPAGGLLIDGKWRDASGSRRIAVVDPATEQQIAEIAAATAADVDLAVRAAHRTFESTLWQKMRPLDRGRLLEKLALLIPRMST
jgi:phenylacetaldehyde dehydrogenase